MSDRYELFNGGLSRKIEVGDLGVPFREIPVSTGETLRIYDTSGPDHVAPGVGLPKRRAAWIRAREERGRPGQPSLRSSQWQAPA